MDPKEGRHGHQQRLRMVLLRVRVACNSFFFKKVKKGNASIFICSVLLSPIAAKLRICGCMSCPDFMTKLPEAAGNEEIPMMAPFRGQARVIIEKVKFSVVDYFFRKLLEHGWLIIGAELCSERAAVCSLPTPRDCISGGRGSGHFSGSRL